MQHSRTTLLALRRRYAGLPPSGAKQIGLRRIRDALRYVGRAEMAEHLAQLAAQAEFYLPYAEAERA